MNIEAFILVGGRSRRFGSPKATAVVGGEKMAVRIADAIGTALGGSKVRIVAANEMQFSRLGDLEVLGKPVFDVFPDRGPAGGLHSALLNSKSEWTFIAACDIPLVSGDVISFLSDQIDDNFDVVVPTQPDGRLQPLMAFYRTKTVLERLMKLFEEMPPAPSMHAILDGLRLRTVSFHEIEDLAGAEQNFANVNSPEDLRKIESGKAAR